MRTPRPSQVAQPLAAALLSVLVACGGDGADSTPYNAQLAGVFATPANASTSTGVYAFDVADDWIFYLGSLTRLDPAEVLGIEVHAGAPGEDGPTILSLSTDLFVRGSQGYQDSEGTLTEADLLPAPEAGIAGFADAVAAIRAGRAYVEVRTTAVPDGEIRGAIVPGRATRLRSFTP
jgi:hypothetical protein